MTSSCSLTAVFGEISRVYMQNQRRDTVVVWHDINIAYIVDILHATRRTIASKHNFTSDMSREMLNFPVFGSSFSRLAVFLLQWFVVSFLVKSSSEVNGFFPAGFILVVVVIPRVIA